LQALTAGSEAKATCYKKRNAALFALPAYCRSYPSSLGVGGNISLWFNGFAFEHYGLSAKRKPTSLADGYVFKPPARHLRQTLRIAIWANNLRLEARWKDTDSDPKG